MPLVSIILPTRDRPDVLGRAVASVLAQTEPDFQLLVIDNGARFPVDPAVVPGASDSRVQIVRACASCAGAARNVGLEAAGGEWITYLDDDDAFRPAKLEAQVSLARISAAPLVLCAADIHLAHGRRRLRLAGRTSFERDDLLGASISTPMLLHRRARARFDPTLLAGEDHHLLLTLMREFGVAQVPVVGEPLVDVYQDQPERERTNVRALPGWRAARRCWWEFRREFRPEIRRRFALRSLVTRAKLERDVRGCLSYGFALIRCGGASEFRFVANALAVAAGIGRGRFIT